MARKRQISPEIIMDEDISDMEPAGRLFYIYLWMICDDSGVFEITPKKLKAQTFPYDNIDIQPFYDFLVEKGKVIEFEINNRKYGFIKAFHKWQKIQHPSSSPLPLPPKPYRDFIPENIRLQNKYQAIREDSVNSTVGLIEDSYRIEKNRTEEIKKEQNIKKTVFKEEDSIITDEEIKSLKMIYEDEEKLLSHLGMRNISENEKKRVIMEVFGEES